MNLDLVAEADRLEFLPQHFGNDALQFEGMIFAYAEHQITDYNGGYWEFGLLDNGAPVMIWLGMGEEDMYQVVCDTNFFNDQMSALEVSLGLNIVVNNLMGWKYHEKGDHETSQEFFDRYEKIKSWVYSNLKDDQISRIHRYLD